jgi:hypothetical protein
MTGYDGVEGNVIDEVVVVQTDVDGHLESRNFFYVVPRLASYDLIIGLPWMKKNDAVLEARKNRMVIWTSGTVVYNQATTLGKELNCSMVSAAAFMTAVRRSKKLKQKSQVFSASLADINKALAVKTRTDPAKVLPKQYSDFLRLFDRTEAEKLPPHRGKADHHIELEKVDGKEPEVPWGRMYDMSRDELLVLRKTLTEYLDKGFIRVSSSPASAPVLFVRKPSGGLRFCVDYRGLNKITRKDRYPLPLIYETLRNIGQAKWYTKLDVIAAFHKIRIAEGQEWMTAFRTRYGLYEWLVTPFGLANAPSTFQKYINYALQDYLDEFCSAYIDDVLVYTNGSLKKHREHVRKVLAKLQNAGLQLDIDKCEFEVQSTKYLGFIIEASKGVRMDPEKVKAIVEWEAPRSVKGVQSFIGFANFYRRFIDKFSDIVRPIINLIRKDQAFKWTDEANLAFEKLKRMFISGPILSPFEHHRTTVIETDSSGWCIGGTLFQEDDEGMLRPCAYYSKKNSSAECNYEIYDKEMLAIVRCLGEWDADLRSVESFQIRTDHKNLEYFMSVQKLTERQMRWSLILSKYNFTISYIKGKDNPMADALSRRDQDIPKDASDDRIRNRMVQLIKPEQLPRPQGLYLAPIRTVGPDPRSNGTTPLQEIWDSAKASDASYEKLCQAVRAGDRVFPSELEVKVSINECALSQEGELLFRGRRWVPESEELRTRLIQEMHDSTLGGHPGREGTIALMVRQFHWPKMMSYIRRFVRNCDTCSRNKAWRDKYRGFLKPLPIPSQIWREISIDFIIKLPLNNSCINLMIITNRLNKGVILEGLKEITAEAVAECFVRCFYRYHGFPKAIVSDRGVQFVGDMWTRVCRLLRVVRRISTAFHPETDGSTERMNQQVETYLRAFISYAQDDWEFLLAMAQLSINNREAASTGVSPFFLTHGYNMDVVQLEGELQSYVVTESPTQKADNLVRRLRDASQWAQAAMATAQQVQEEQANRSRDQAMSYKIGDKVWLNLKNVRTSRLSKKLDHKNAKFTVIEVISSHSYRLNTPAGIHNVFHTTLLRPAADDPFPSQATYDNQPLPLIIGGEEEYGVEAILDERVKRIGRGSRLEYLVKWNQWHVPTWEPASNLENVAALDAYEAGKARRGPRIRETERGGRRQKRLEREAQEREQGLPLVPLQRRRGRPQKS